MAKSSRILRRSLFYSSVVGSIFIVVYPIFNMALGGINADLSAFWAGKGFVTVPGIPFYNGGWHPSLVNLVDALQIDAFPKLILNSTVISLLSVGMALSVGIPTGYFLARGNLKGRKSIEFILLALRTVLPLAIVVPLYILFSRVGLWNTYFGVAIAYLAVNLPVVVLMLRSFFVDVPKELYEAAEMSGASERQIFRRVAMPAILLGVVATAIFAFVVLYNEFLLADILTGGATKTVAVGVWTGAGENIQNNKTLNYDQSNAYGTIAFIPAIIIILTIKRYLARGFTLATTK